MNSPRKTIKLRMSPRELKDSPEILQTVADIFNGADVDLDIDLRDDSTKTSESVELQTAKEAEESAKAALDLQDQAVREGMATVSTPEENKVETRRWLKTLRDETIRIVGNIISGIVVGNW